MAHEIETFTDGSAAFFSARQDAWHRLGTVTADCLTAEQVMQVAHLGGWNVRKLDLTAHELTADGVRTLRIPDKFATVRTHPVSGNTEYLGTVGTDYEPVQNESSCEVLNYLIDASGAHFETAGSLRGGRETFVTMKLPAEMVIGGVDRLTTYLAALNSHDGTSAFRLIASPVRIVCANTQRMAENTARSSFAIRHTASAKARIAQARQALGLTWRYCEQFQRAAEQMINQTLTLADFERTVDQLWPLDPDPGPRTRSNHQRRHSALRVLFRDAPTNASIRGTRWAGYQSVTEYLDHHAPAKDGDVRAARVLTSGAIAEVKSKAFALFRA
jgi:phage/plasmid-like protein (TIGR03299 family)